MGFLGWDKARIARAPFGASRHFHLKGAELKCSYPTHFAPHYNVSMSKNTQTKLNQRQEIFAQEIALGKTQESAYIAAGYSEKTARVGASRMLTNANISARVRELQSQTSMRNAATADDLLAELEKARKMAMGMGQSHAAVLAIMAKARLLGIV